MISVEAHSEGAVLRVRAQPGARSSGIRGEQAGALKVSVTQVAEHGKANHAIRLLLSKKLSLRRSQIELISGEATQQWRYLIRKVTPDQLVAIVDRILE